MKEEKGGGRVCAPSPYAIQSSSCDSCNKPSCGARGAPGIRLFFSLVVSRLSSLSVVNIC